MPKPAAEMFPQKVAIFGMGFMGGSLGLAIRRFCPEVEITGIDVDQAVLNLARSREAVHQATRDLKIGVKNADIVFLATPVHAALEILKQLPALIGREAIVTDLCSTKAAICRAAQKVIPNQFVGGHPMTGSEIQGMKGSDPYLFENAVYLLAPLKPKDKNVSKLTRFLERLGASVMTISPSRHDEVAAYVSHLPQLLAVALTCLVSGKNAKQPRYKELAAGGFRDMTRIASSPYAMWHDILESNAFFIKGALDDLIQKLQALRRLLGKQSLGNFFERAAGFREKLPMRRKGFIKPLHRIVVSVQDEQGVLAILTAAIAKAQINISDIELMKVREGFGGTFQLYFATPQDADRAAKTLRATGYESRVIE